MYKEFKTARRLSNNIRKFTNKFFLSKNLWLAAFDTFNIVFKHFSLYYKFEEYKLKRDCFNAT